MGPQVLLGSHRPHLENGREEARAAAPVRDQKRAARHDWHRLGLDRKQHARSDPAADCLSRRTLACAPLLVAIWRTRGLAAASVRVTIAECAVCSASSLGGTAPRLLSSRLHLSLIACGIARRGRVFLDKNVSP